VDPALHGNEDWDLWVRLAERGSFVFVDEVLAQFRMHPGRFTSARGRLPALLAGRIQVLDRAFEATTLPMPVRAARPLIYRNAYVDIGLRWLAVGAGRSAAAAFGEALRVGGNPVATLARIAYLTLFYRLVRRYSWATAISDIVFRWRRTRRTLPGVGHAPGIRGTTGG
jgi:hypothetical protein